jgi:hypothetical protein
MVPTIVSALLFGLAALVAYGARLHLTALRGCPKRSCAEAAPGPERIKLSGVARADEPMLSPLTRTPCVFYALTIYRSGGGLDQMNTPPSQRRKGAGGIFASSRTWTHWRLEDATGSIEVDGEGAEVRAPRLRAASTSLVGDEELGRLLDEYHVPRGPLVTCHVDEEVLPVDEPTFVCGRVKRGANGAFLGGGGELLVSGKPERELLRRDRQVFAGAAAAAGLALLGLLASIALQLGVLDLGLEPERYAADPAHDMRPIVPPAPSGEGRGAYGAGAD